MAEPQKVCMGGRGVRGVAEAECCLAPTTTKIENTMKARFNLTIA